MAAKKKIKGYIKLQIQAGKANPAPPVGPALGQHGVQIQQFCQQFNDETQAMSGPIPVEITVYEDRSFTFTLKQPPMSYLILQEAKIKKGSGTPSKEVVAKLSKDQLKKIAEVKMPDLNAASMEAAMRIVAGTARSMGIETEVVA